tara:strand:- start:91 stop:312 length:222 start_codon:yes stop_codon:yes gene_type:complete
MSTTEIPSEVTGRVWKIVLGPGAKVDEGDPILILESMKMEIPVEAPCKGIVTEICVAEGDAIAEDQIIAILEN